MVKNLPAIYETQVLSLGQEDPWRRERQPHSSIFEWRIPWIQEPGSIILAVGTLIETFVLKSYISYSLLPPPLVSSGTIVTVK